ncbi:sec4-like phosphatidylinositol transfer-like protein [Trypanosoma rangeli]|uniref:Sec4-like phosphatidylinositol transfer-like protein n=1 Tax=Trypanosoma rangeli TaxID=5698 RepID=A0A3R7MB63_TRYRA|nr:sec4-like phosphatidylinositol transfer-like protein [Trypanosoma rangeli]RNF12285.1 sec4-like phosphatidylinositol transfer-like protein [Trypanosoma rangeli]|eukprot:RNF12285.1 sec4-like phosphatidylinositol transfer-like protein [Trypanosoma rangeli]
MALDAVSAPTVKEIDCVKFLKQELPSSLLDPEDAGFLTEATYLRFARARNADKKKASTMLRSCLEWRKEFRPYKVSFDEVERAMQQLTTTVAGCSLKGEPVVVMSIGAPNPCEVEERVKQIVYILEEAMRRGDERLTWIIDFAQMGKHPRDPRSSGARKATMKIMQDYYPEMLGTLLVYRSPWYIRFLYTAVRPFMDARTRKKVLFLGHEEKLLLLHVAKDQLPTSLGGTYSNKDHKTLWE